MSTFIASATNVVKENVGNDCWQSWHIHDVKTLAERARWVMQLRGLGQREWCDLAEVSHGYLSAFFDRVNKNPDAGMRNKELVALARAANVSVEWLSTGVGSPVLGTEKTTQPVPDEGTTWARAAGWAESVEEMDREHPGIPRKLIAELGETRSTWAPNPMNAQWLWLQASLAMKAMSPEEAYRLGMEEGERLLEERLRQQQEREKSQALVSPVLPEPALPGVPITLSQPPEPSPPSQKREPKPKTKKTTPKQLPLEKKR